MAELSRIKRVEIKLDALMEAVSPHAVETAKARMAAGMKLLADAARPTELAAAGDATELTTEDWRRIEAGLFMATDSVRFLSAEKAYESTLAKVRRFRGFLEDEGK